MNIYQTLGIPPTLTGTFGASGTTNNLISLKTLTERLKYARNLLVGFWNTQLEIVQKSMGFRFPAIVDFDFMNLEDSAAVNQLLINLADRGVISDEFVQRHIGSFPSLERQRIAREEKERKSGRAPMKASPYHDPDKEHNLERVFAQTGAVTPGELGLELKPKRKGEKTALEQRAVKPAGIGTPGNKTQTPKKTSTPGRPKNSPDTKPRKPKTFKPETKAALDLWAKQAQLKISEVLNPGFLNAFNKRNMRSLTNAEHIYVERIKFEVLCNLEPFQTVDADSIVAALSLTPITAEQHSICNQWVDQASKELNRPLTIEEIRNIKSTFYIYHQEDDFSS